MASQLMIVKPRHPENDFSPIEIVFLGMLSVINFWQSLNAQSSMLEMFSGSPISVSEEHPKKFSF